MLKQYNNQNIKLGIILSYRSYEERGGFVIITLIRIIVDLLKILYQINKNYVSKVLNEI